MIFKKYLISVEDGRTGANKSLPQLLFTCAQKVRGSNPSTPPPLVLKKERKDISGNNFLLFNYHYFLKDKLKERVQRNILPTC